MTQPDGRVQWLTDLIRLEILLWDQIDARLKREHDLPLAFFETLYMISRSAGTSLRIGDLAQRLRITVGGTSKLADRIEAAGLIRRKPDSADRRASRVTLTPAGRHKLATAVQTYDADLAATLDAVLSDTEQQLMHELVTRLLAAANESPAKSRPGPKTSPPKTAQHLTTRRWRKRARPATPDRRPAHHPDRDRHRRPRPTTQDGHCLVEIADDRCRFARFTSEMVFDSTEAEPPRTTLTPIRKEARWPHTRLDTSSVASRPRPSTGSSPRP